MYTRQELWRYLRDEFCGQCFEPHIRYVQENFDHDRFNVDLDQYYSLGSLPQERNPICCRDNFYVADISDVYFNEARGEHYSVLTGFCLPGFWVRNRFQMKTIGWRIGGRSSSGSR